MHIIHRQTCRVCDSEYLVPVIDIGYQYLQGSFVKEGYPQPPLRRIPTQLVRCDTTRKQDACGLLQLAHTLPPKVLYTNYWYRSGTNETMRGHLKGVTDSILGLLPENCSNVLDIGCNDGTLLGCFPADFERTGVDPSDIAKEVDPSIRVVQGLFPSDNVMAGLEGSKFDAVTSIAMFYDLEQPVKFAQSVKKVLADTGIWVVEMSYLPQLLHQNSFDTICHEHLEYYSLAVLEYIALQSDMQIFKVELNGINGGSIRCYLTHANNNIYQTDKDQDFIRWLQLREFELELDTDAPYRAFQNRIESIRDQVKELLLKLHGDGKTIHIYGASTKGNVLLQWCGIDASLIECASDRSAWKDGAKILGSDIPIVSEEKSRRNNPDYYLVLPWHFKREFLEREREMIEAGTKMIFPLPELTIVSQENLAAELEKSKIEDPLEFWQPMPKI
jgi:hypothetical protein